LSVSEIPKLFDKSVAVFGAPSRYLQGQDALNWLGTLAVGLGDRALIVTDSTIVDLYGARLHQILKEVAIDISWVLQDGDLLQSTAKTLLSGHVPQARDIVIAVGGGRAIDTGKAVAERLNTPLITVPTAASNDAPTSKNFVLYDADHRIAEVRNLTRNPDYVLVDTKVIAQAPKAFFSAGIGDALSKLIEADACQRSDGINMFRARPTLIARAIAAECEATLLEHGLAALEVAGTGIVTQAFEACVEANILMAGLAFENGGLSVAHALCRGLPLIPEITACPHGLQVAYGIMVQKTLEGSTIDPRFNELMNKAELPMTYHKLAGRKPQLIDFETVADGTMGALHLQNFPSEISRDQLVAAMAALER